MLLRVLWNLWRQDSNQAFITLDDMIKSQPEVEPKLVRVLFRKIDAGGRGKVSYGDLRTWFGKEHAKVTHLVVTNGVLTMQGFYASLSLREALHWFCISCVHVWDGCWLPEAQHDVFPQNRSVTWRAPSGTARR